VTINGEVAGIEVFGDVMSFGKDGFGILVDAYVPNAIQKTEGNMSASSVRSAISSFLRQLEQGERCVEVVKHNGKLVYAQAV